MGPAFLSDTELADLPIIVVARWNNSDFTSRHKYRTETVFEDPDRVETDLEVVTKVEAYTTLEVLLTIKGDLTPGVHPLMVGWGIGWSKEGTGVSSASSTEIRGDVSDITLPNIWFLKLERSWDEMDQERYLSIDNYRAIQPLMLEPYFAGIRSEHPEREVPKFLKSNEPEVIDRALRFVCGGCWPWPYVSDFDTRYQSPKKRGKILRGEAEAVAGLVEQEGLNDLRPKAVAVYAELTGKKCGPRVAGFLTSEDPNVRGMAVAVLARNKCARSIPKMIHAVSGVADAGIGCKIIEAIRCWGDIRLAPALISFLQNGNSAGYCGDDLFIPAIKARAALQQVTEYVFPYDVAASMAAWAKAGMIANSEQRIKLLSSLVPCDPTPLNIEIIGGVQEAYLRVLNTSKHAVTVAKQPSHGTQSTPGGLNGCFFGADREISGKQNFLTLQPGDSLKFEVELEDGFLLPDPGSRTMTVVYDNNGGAFGINAWIGSVSVSFGTDWKEVRKIETVEEAWPNGNLKSTGQTVNGERYGEWNFFNEEGDRIETVYYGFGKSVGHRPEHPSNKGAGKRLKQE